MITVRFPNGQAVQYNDAKRVHTDPVRGFTDLYEDYKDDKYVGWIAQVPNACIIERIPPCRVYNPLADTVNEKVAAELKAVTKELRALRRKVEK